MQRRLYGTITQMRLPLAQKHSKEHHKLLKSRLCPVVRRWLLRGRLDVRRYVLKPDNEHRNVVLRSFTQSIVDEELAGRLRIGDRADLLYRILVAGNIPQLQPKIRQGVWWKS